jgi:hypothetical protein
MPSFVAERAYRRLGSETLIDFIDEIIEDENSESLRKLLLELSPERAIDRISALVDSQGVERWFLAIITQRPYSYYSTRPYRKNWRQNLKASSQTFSLDSQAICREPQGRQHVLDELRLDQPLLVSILTIAANHLRTDHLGCRGTSDHRNPKLTDPVDAAFRGYKISIPSSTNAGISGASNV